MQNSQFLKDDEKAILSFRSLYQKYGYLPFKMSKFEEYDLYVKNKDFLVSDSVITFNDTNGKLLALKPDVTLSIIKNSTDEIGCKQKVYYNENVYRISGATHQFKEIMQAGLECIGDLDIYDVYEVLYLSAKSLATISDNFVLDISHLGILNALFNKISANEDFKSEIMTCIKQKNAHEISLICEKYSVNEENANLIKEFISLYGSPRSVITRLKEINVSEEFFNCVSELESIYTLLANTEYNSKIRLDFSLVNDMNYYNGIVFNGFLEGIPETVLFGGSYDKLLERMGRKSKGIGFALYLDLLEAIKGNTRKYDVDILLIYNDKTEISSLNKVVQNYVSEGKSVSVQKAIPQKLRYKELIDLSKEA